MKETAAKKTGYTMDWITLTIPFGAIVLMCIAFFLAPEQSKHVLDGIRFFLGDTFHLRNKQTQHFYWIIR